MTEIFTARSVDEAKELAAKKFGKKISEIKFEIIDEGKKGLFGLGSKEAKVKATVIEGTAQTTAAPKAAAPVEAPKAPVTTAPAPKAEPVVKTVQEEKPVVTTETTAVKAEEKTAEAAVEVPEESEEAYSLDNFTLIEDEALINPKVKLARDYITSILRAMDVDAEYKDYYRITIDCLGYRSKRKETLEQLAAKVAKSVLRTGRSQPLEPMNPYERRVIHSAISNIEGVSSRSVGEEPYRKIIISSNNPRRGGGRRDNNRRDGGRRNDRRGGERRNNNRDREVSMERRSVDLSTSFEKDYKRPKPEDEIQGGLYGKIEL